MNPDFSESLEAFSGRFCCLQDTIGDKLLPAWLLATGDQPKTVMDNLIKAGNASLSRGVGWYKAIKESNGS